MARKGRRNHRSKPRKTPEHRANHCASFEKQAKSGKKGSNKGVKISSGGCDKPQEKTESATNNKCSTNQLDAGGRKRKRLRFSSSGCFGKSKPLMRNSTPEQYEAASIEPTISPAGGKAAKPKNATNKRSIQMNELPSKSFDSLEKANEDVIPIKRKGIKIYQDRIHGSIELEAPLVLLMDTLQFGRTDNLRQLGLCFHVYRGATHTRFEHMVGVAHLAGRLVRTLMRKQPELKITEEEYLCVKIAGMVHDLGHGPFSHLFDGPFLAAMGIKWAHEDGSVDMFEYLLEENRITAMDLGISENGLIFIKELIKGTEEKDRKYAGHEGKGFLYDIVNNRRSGLDVDKLDYYLRDKNATAVEVEDNKGIDRYITLARVCLAFDDKGHLCRMICYPEKMVLPMLKFFETRWNLHTLVYQHKTIVAIQLMVVDIFLYANDHVLFPGKQTRKFPNGYKLSECIQDMEAFCGLTDVTVMHDIEREARNSQQPGLVKAGELIYRYKRHQQYRFIGQIRIPPSSNLKKEDIVQELGEIHRKEQSQEKKLAMEEIRVVIQKIHYGKGMQNPVNQVRFYAKGQEMQENYIARKIDQREYEDDLPRSFQKKCVQIYCTSLDQHKHQEALHLFEQWCKDKDLSAPFMTTRAKMCEV